MPRYLSWNCCHAFHLFLKRSVRALFLSTLLSLFSVEATRHIRIASAAFIQLKTRSLFCCILSRRRGETRPAGFKWSRSRINAGRGCHCTYHRSCNQNQSPSLCCPQLLPVTHAILEVPHKQKHHNLDLQQVVGV